MSGRLGEASGRERRMKMDMGRERRLRTERVGRGETLETMAQRAKLSVSELRRLNNLRDEKIMEGDMLVIERASRLDDIRPGRRRTNRVLFSRQREREGDMMSRSTNEGRGIGGNEGEKTIKGIEGRWDWKRKGPRQPQSRFTSPMGGDWSFTSPFGWRSAAHNMRASFHEGVDLAADQGSPILAAERGIVTFAGWSGGYGNLVIIQHEGGFATRYGHCCTVHSRKGQHVARRQQVAAVGSTGLSTGPHLHFEVRRKGEALDPLKWVNL